MDDQAVGLKKTALDDALAKVGPNVGIKFGAELFDEFRKRGWLTLETFGVLGTGFLSEKLPAYGRTHFAYVSWDVSDNDFQAGNDAQRP